MPGKYLSTEGTIEGYIIVFDTRIPVGAVCETQTYQAGNKKVTSLTIAIEKLK